MFLYYHLMDIGMFDNVSGYLVTGLRNTIILLLLYQVLRFISAKTQGIELVCPSRGSEKDLFDNRQVTGIDFILFFIYYITTFILLFIG